MGSLLLSGCTTCPWKPRLECQKPPRWVYRAPPPSKFFSLIPSPQSHSRVKTSTNPSLLHLPLRILEMSTVRFVSATISTETSPHTTRTVTGSWDLIPTTATPEAGSSTIISGTRVSVELPTPPPQASTHAPHQSLQQGEVDPFDNFFGVLHSSPRSSRIGGTHESRHDGTLPSYHHGEELPAYSRWDEEAGPKEPPTLAMYMFKYGFCKSHRIWASPTATDVIFNSVPYFLDHRISYSLCSPSCTCRLGTYQNCWRARRAYCSNAPH